LNFQDHVFQAEIKISTNRLAFSDMKMRTLQSQLSPHFLYNSLSSISGLVRRSEKHKTLDMIADLGELLRFSINASKLPFIELNEEVHFTKKYIELQKIRFGEKFDVELNYSTEDQYLMCPPFILQTLVENAFVHSNHPDQKSQKIKVVIQKINQQLKFQVINSLFPVKNKNNYIGMGVALNNLEKRLSILFDNNFELSKKELSEHYQTMVLIPIDQHE
jgi:LytS/YehU family sensor histidine kinase